MSTELTTIYLVGSLGKAVGREKWTLDVKSPAEAIRAINVNTRGALEKYLTGPARDRLYRIALQKRDNVIDPEEATHRSGHSTIYILPTIKGRNSGVGKIIVGSVLIAIGVFTSAFGGEYLINAGIAMILGGTAQLLTPTPQGPTTQPEQAQSTTFQGNATTVVQGGCVPVVYGRALVGPIPVSITITNNEVSVSSAGTLGGIVINDLPGGGTQFDSDTPPDWYDWDDHSGP